MNEPITIAKVRKDTKITVPAGGWILLVGPDKHFAEHAARRAKIVSADLVNEEYETVCVGRLRNTHSEIRLMTSDQRKAADAEIERANKALSKSADEAKKRDTDLEASLQKSQSDSRADEVAKANKFNDEIRNRR